MMIYFRMQKRVCFRLHKQNKRVKTFCKQRFNKQPRRPEVVEKINKRKLDPNQQIAGPCSHTDEMQKARTHTNQPSNPIATGNDPLHANQVATCTGRRAAPPEVCLLPSAGRHSSADYSNDCTYRSRRDTGYSDSCCAYGQSKWCVAYRSGRRPSASLRGCLRTGRRRRVSGMVRAPLACRRPPAPPRSPRDPRRL